MVKCSSYLELFAISMVMHCKYGFSVGFKHFNMKSHVECIKPELIDNVYRDATNTCAL